MARRRSSNRRWSRRSTNDSAVLDRDSNYIDEEDDTFWRHLPDQTRYSITASINASNKVFLNSNSRIIDDDDIEATEWWNHLHKTSQDLLVPRATARADVSNSDLANISNGTSHSGANSITEAIKKKRVMLGIKRKSSGKNPFSQALDSSDNAVESEPITALKKKNISESLSRSVEDGMRPKKRSRISKKSNVRYSPDSNTSTDTEKRSKARPLLFRRPKRESSSAFDKILLENISTIGSSQSSSLNKNEISNDRNEVKESHEDTNKTKEFMTQPRSPFDKISRSSRKSKVNIIIQSQEDESCLEIPQNLKIRKTPQKSIDNSVNNKTFENAAEITDISIINKRKNSHDQISDSDESCTSQLSDEKISEKDRSLPTRSRHSLQVSSLSSKNKIIKTRKSNRLSKKINDQNNANPVETILKANKSTNGNSQSEQISVIDVENKTLADDLSNRTSSTESLFEAQKSGGDRNSGVILLDQNVSADHENEEIFEFEVIGNNHDSNNMYEKSLQESLTQISNNTTKRLLKQQIAEISHYDNEDEIESSLKVTRNIACSDSQRSLKQTIIEHSLNNDIKQSSFEKRGISNNESNVPLKKRLTSKIPSIHEDEEYLELEEETQENNVERDSTYLENRQAQLNLSIEKIRKDETEKYQKLLSNRKTKETSVSYRDEEKESDKENDVTDKFQKYLKNGQIQLNVITAEEEKDEDKSEPELMEGQENLTEDIQASIKQRKLSSMQSISRKLFSENLEDRSSTMIDLSEKSRESSRSLRNIDPSSYELPNRTRSDSYSESDTDDVHNNLVIANEELVQSTTDNMNLFNPSANVQTPLLGPSTNKHSKLSNKFKTLKINTLDRYLLNSKSNFEQSKDTQLSQEQLQALGDKLKKIKEKTDKLTEKEVKRVHEKIEKIQNSTNTKLPIQINLRNVKNKNKTPNKPVNKAYVVDGIFYKQPKLPRPQKWATNRLYKFLWKKLEPKYNIDTRKKSETFVKYLSDVVKVIKRRKHFESYEEDLNELIKKMAQLGIIKTRMDFHNFCFDFLPYAFRVKVTPMIMPGNIRNIPFDPEILQIPILHEQ